MFERELINFLSLFRLLILCGKANVETRIQTSRRCNTSTNLPQVADGDSNQAGREARGLARHVGWPEVVEQRRRLFFQATGNGTVLELENEMLSTQLTELFDYRRKASNHRPAFMAEVGMRGNKTHRNRQLDDKIYFIWVL